MPASQSNSTQQRPERGGPDAQAPHDQPEAARQRAQTVANEAGEASKEALRANSEILRSHVETAQRATRTGLEATAQRFEDASRVFVDAFGLGAPGNDEAARRSSRDIKAVSEAGAILAKGAQEASGRWAELVQQTARRNLEGFNRLTTCRSMGEIVAFQSQFMRESLQQAIQTGRDVAQSSIRTMEEAGRQFPRQGGQL